MAGAVTPVRRRRDDESSENPSSSATMDEDDGGSRRNKRARHDGGTFTGRAAGSSAIPSSPEQPVLPDHFRRSPKSKQRATAWASAPAGSSAKKFQPGSIVRVVLSNFVTYTKAEFLCGPNLNMVIGPNGTGKSTLVCAICLGLGGATSVLGRAKDVNEFIKHGAKRAEVEIELAKDPARTQHNTIIKMRINRDDSKCTFSIDGKAASRKAVQDLGRSFSIQIDNLCQFLPQDRVVEFAALSPVELLTQTQRAAAPDHVSAWHEELKALGKEEKQKKAESEVVQEQLKSLEERQRSQESEVGRLRERKALQDRVVLFERLRPISVYLALTTQHRDAKLRRKEASKELGRLERNIAPSLQAKTDKEAYRASIEAKLPAQGRLLKRVEEAATNKLKELMKSEEQIQKCTGKITAEREAGKKTRSDIMHRQKEIRQLEQSMQNPPADFDPAEYNDQIQEKREEIRAKQNQATESAEQRESLQGQLDQRQTIASRYEDEKVQLQSQVGRQLSKLEKASRDTAKAWQWIQDNPTKFSGDVYGPPMLMCSVKNARHADVVETIVGRSELLALTVTTQEDFRVLSTQVYSQMKLNDVNIRSILQPLSSFRSPVSRENLESMGFDCWVQDMLEGPDAVLAMLCDQRGIGRTAFSARDIGDNAYETIKNSGITSWVANGQHTQITIRREYGAQGVSSRSTRLKPAQLFTDAPVDVQEEQRLNRQIAEVRSDIAELEEQLHEMSQKTSQLGKEVEQAKVDLKAVQDEKAVKQTQRTQFDGLPLKLDKAKEKLQAALDQVRNSRDVQLAARAEADAFALEKCQHAIEYANLLDSLRDRHVQAIEGEILRIEAQSDLDQLSAQHQQEISLLEERRQEVGRLRELEDDLLSRGRVLADECRGITNSLTPEEAEIHAGIAQWEPDRFETELQSVQAQLDMLQGGGGANTIKEFEQRAIKIEQRQDKHAELSRSLEDLSAKIIELRQQWEPELDSLVGQISEAFAENFSRIHCSGEVAVHKDEDFDKWAIEIRVKFRESEQLSILDSHRQSGGERAVSTIYYLMAMQSLARAPFRVVDEINQGMDPRNERLVHSRMVEIACAEHTSQYFLITPKLLSGLKYHPNMKVHCIASGEYIPSDHRELNFDELARKALAIRAAG